MRQLPELPTTWQDKFFCYDNEHWAGWINKDYASRQLDHKLNQPESFFSEEQVICWYKRNRNRLAEVRWPAASGLSESSVVLKAYGTRTQKTTLRTLVRPPRAFRHFFNAERILSRGFQTPMPVFLAMPKSQQVNTFYLGVETVVEHMRLKDLIKKYEEGSDSIIFNQHEVNVSDLVRFCGQFIKRFHEARLFHRDLSGGNLLISGDWDGQINTLSNSLQIVDVNRMRVMDNKGFSIKSRIMDLERIDLPDKFLETFYLAYAGEDQALISELPRFLKYRKSFRRIRQIKSPFWRVVMKTTNYWPRTI